MLSLHVADGAADLIGEVALLEPLGSDLRLEVAHRGAATITGRVEPDRRLRLGEMVAVQLHGRSCTSSMPLRAAHDL